MMNRIVYLKIVSICLLIFLLITGFFLARYKPLWVDEVYSQEGLQKLSYIQIICGGISEGNNSPLFYLIQKGISDLAGYRLPAAEYETKIWDARARILLRVGPNVSMALALTFIFYFFARYYGVWAGLYGFLTALFSYNLWLYWAEARPYALWFFLTTMQSLIFLNLARQNEADRGSWRWLTGVHIALSLTAIFSFAQIAAVSLLLFLFKEREWKKYIWLTVLPCALCIPYYFLAVKARFFFPKTALQLIEPCFPREWMGLMVLYAVFLAVPLVITKLRPARVSRPPSNLNDPIGLTAGSYLAFTALMFLAAAIVLAIFKANAITQEQGGFEISHRYFIYLTPVGIIAMTVFAVHWIKACKGHPWLLANIMLGLWGFLAIGALRNCVWAIWFF